MKQNYLISHYDADGVGSAIILSQGMKFDVILKGGYKKFDGFIEQVPKGSNVVVSDCAFTMEQYLGLKSKTNNIIYIDHHPDSQSIKEAFTNDNIVYSSEKAAAGLCLDFIGRGKELSKEIKMLGYAVNYYDLFQREEQPDWFALGYDLNILFWEYHFDKFFDRFKNGFKGYTKEEKEFIKAFKIKRDNDIDESQYFEMGKNVKGLVCIPKSHTIMNDVPFRKTGYDIYYIIMQYPKGTSISVRTPEIDITKNLHYITSSPYIQNAGGHPNASGITFYGTPSHEDLVEIINELHTSFDDPFYKDVPF